MQVEMSASYVGGAGGMPVLKLPGGAKVDRPHPEWSLHQLRWRWLLDSWEGGEAYRTAVYGMDMRGMPVRNMVRHKREYPAPGDSSFGTQTGRPGGTDMAAQSTDDDYELRRARTPVPSFVSECVETHLARIYSREVKRDGPQTIVTWWQDVDGRGASMDQWMAGTISPLLSVLGQLDVIVDLPPLPPGESVRSRGDEMRLGLDRPVASYILPENMVWWKLKVDGCYSECIVRECQDDQSITWRYWNEKLWALYDSDGKAIESRPHPYKCVPIRRMFDRRRPRARNIGLPRYEVIAEIQREYYNRDSELILSDSTQAHPLLQGPEDFIKPDGTIAIGPNWLLPKVKSTTGTSVSYEGFDVVEFPKDGAESIRINKHDLRDAADRAACLTKPAGAAGTQGQTVSQSGVSKQMDSVTGNDLLGKVSKMLQRAEETICDLYWCVMGDESQGDSVEIQYPTEFDLAGALELADLIGRIQMILSTAGISPDIEKPLISRLLKVGLPGLEDEEYETMDLAIDKVTAQGPPQPEGYDNGR